MSEEHRVAGRFYVNNDGGFTPEQYADMIMTKLFESAKNYPPQIKTKILEAKFEVHKIVLHYVAEAMADERRRIGRLYELNDKTKARLMLPAGYAERLDNGGVWSEALMEKN